MLFHSKFSSLKEEKNNCFSFYRPRALVLYGTETGTSKRYAETLRELLSHRYYVSIRSLEAYTVNELQRGEKEKNYSLL